jgi:hypothetical protein
MVTPRVTELHRAGSRFEPARILALRIAQVRAPGSTGGARNPVESAGSGQSAGGGR